MHRAGDLFRRLTWARTRRKAALSPIRPANPARRVLAVFAVLAGLVAGGGALAELPGIFAQTYDGNIYIFSSPQTEVSGVASGSVFVQLQTDASPGEPIYQSANKTLDVSCTPGTGVVVTNCPSTLTIPAGGFSTSFQFTTTTTVGGTLTVTVSDPAGNYDESTGDDPQTETIATADLTDSSSFSPGYNGGGSGPTPVAPGQSTTFFTSSGSEISNNSVSDYWYEVRGLDGVFGPGSLSSQTGLYNCIEIGPGDSENPGTVTDVTSPYQNPGTYQLGVLVEAYTGGGCTTAFSYYQVNVTLELNNSAYTPASAPTRLCDTRSGSGDVCAGHTLGAGGSLNLDVITGSVPANATAVQLNVTVTDTTASSYLTVYPTGATQPTASNLNWPAGDTVANAVVVAPGSGGDVTFYNFQGSTDVVVDLEGWYAPPSSQSNTDGSYVPLSPSRICDTRTGSGDACAGHTLGQAGVQTVTVAGQGGVPASGASAVVINVTATNTTAASYFTVYPNTRPTASDINWRAGQTIANRAVVPLSGTGTISVYNFQGSADLVIDVDGYFTNGSSTPSGASFFTPITPVRVCDTRAESKSGISDSCTGNTLGGGGTINVNLTSNALLVPFGPGASAAVLNVTATDTTAPSYFTVYPGPTRPTASDLNWAAGWTVPNLTFATYSSSGGITVYNFQGSADLVIDVDGYFTPES